MRMIFVCARLRVNRMWGLCASLALAILLNWQTEEIMWYVICSINFYAGVD